MTEIDKKKNQKKKNQKKKNQKKNNRKKKDRKKKNRKKKKKDEQKGEAHTTKHENIWETYTRLDAPELRGCSKLSVERCRCSFMVKRGISLSVLGRP